MKSGLEKINLKFHEPLQICCCPEQKKKAKIGYFKSRNTNYVNLKISFWFLKLIWALFIKQVEYSFNSICFVCMLCYINPDLFI